MKKNIEDLLRRAKGAKEALDDKTWCGNISMLELINEGAQIIKKNVKQCSGTYVTEVIYEGYIFQTVADYPLRIGPIPECSNN